MGRRSLRNLPGDNIWDTETKEDKKRRKTIAEELREIHKGATVNPFFAKKEC